MKLLAGFLALCLTVIAIVYICHMPPRGACEPPRQQGMVTVSASHSESFSPSGIRFSLRFEKRGADKNLLTSFCQKADDNLAEFVSTLNIPADSISAKRFSLEKAWTWENNRRKPDGFEISQNISVHIPDPRKATEFIEGIATIPDLEIAGSTPELDRETETKNAVYQKAVEKARAKAENLAKASGRKLGKVIFVSDENSASYAEGAFYANDAVALGASRSKRSMPEQKIRIDASVSMKFELK